MTPVFSAPTQSPTLLIGRAKRSQLKQVGAEGLKNTREREIIKEATAGSTIRSKHPKPNAIKGAGQRADP